MEKDKGKMMLDLWKKLPEDFKALIFEQKLELIVDKLFSYAPNSEERKLCGWFMAKYYGGLSPFEIVLFLEEISDLKTLTEEQKEILEKFK